MKREVLYLRCGYIYFYISLRCWEERLSRFKKSGDLWAIVVTDSLSSAPENYHQVVLFMVFTCYITGYVQVMTGENNSCSTLHQPIDSNEDQLLFRSDLFVQKSLSKADCMLRNVAEFPI